MSDLLNIIQKLSAPLIPRQTGMQPQLNPLQGMKAVLVDIYGTVLISGSGDVGTISDPQPAIEFSKALLSQGLDCSEEQAEAGPGLIKTAIIETQRNLKQEGMDVPEVNILKIWGQVLSELSQSTDQTTVEKIALTYECNVNPVWLMPNAQSLLHQIQSSGLSMGIVSNAQFYTPHLLEVLLEGNLSSLGFNKDFCSWSWIESRAKPSLKMFKNPLSALAGQGIDPKEVVYIGNDMLNDVWAAKECGCRTILFAGDNRSLRMRENDDRCVGLKPDAVITDWSQLPEILDL